MAVVRAGGGFGVVLHAEGRQLAVAQPFDGLVVEVDVRDLELGRQGLGIDGEAVVLRGDLDRAGLQVLHRLVRAAVAELELERLRAAGQAEQLVAQADAEDRLLAQQAADRSRCA